MNLSLTALDLAMADRIEHGPFWECESFEELVKKLAEFPSKKGRLMAVSNVGEPYVEFFASAMSRPADMEMIERQVAQAFSRQIAEYIRQHEGMIYWRIEPERDWDDAALVIRFDERGSDKDFYTDRPCFLDRNWKRCSMYCRFIRSAKPELS